jgi:hypothetical protein
LVIVNCLIVQPHRNSAAPKLGLACRRGNAATQLVLHLGLILRSGN